MRGNAVHISLFIIMMTFLFMPLAQEHLFRFDIKPLNGEWTKIDKPKLTLSSYTSNSYQKDIEQYVSENFGFREPTIRIYNEYLWDVFHKTYVKYIVRGDDGWIFYKDDVDSFHGKFQQRKFQNNEKAAAAYDNIALNIYKLRGVLKDFGIEFITFFTPDKCRLYNEHLPKSAADTTTINAVEYFKENFANYDIPYLDMTEVFETIGDTLPFPLIGPGGAHWNFSCVFGIDSVLQFSAKAMNTNIAKINCGELRPYDREITKDNIQDFDAEGMLNLIFPRNHSNSRLYTADVNYISDATCTKPSMLFVGNSFFWRPLDLIKFDSVVSNYRFWYYNNTAYSNGNIVATNKLDYADEILQSDCIVTFCSETQLHEMSFGFVNKALVSLCVPDSIMEREVARLVSKHGISKEEAAEWIYKNTDNITELRGSEVPTIRNDKAIAKANIINEIESDESWMQLLEKHADYREKSLEYITIEEMHNIMNGNTLLRNLDADLCKDRFEQVLCDTISGWRRDKKSVNYMSREAVKRGITFDEMLRINAFWVVNHNEEYFLPKVYSKSKDS